MMEYAQLREKVYAGVLGKLIGVYLGRPIEGWPYEKIQEEFGDVYHYVNRQVGVPLIVADDDISGTFGFFRAMEDYGFSPELTAAQIGETWRNYIIEDKTILWWGGLGHSTEHTAYLNLKRGIDAPDSGSVAQNGRAVAEQIGAQIFIEGFAMCYPGDPEKTAALVRKAASVSHDGLALDAACHLAALDAMAFEKQDLNGLLDEAFRYVSDERLKRMILDVRNICAGNTDWRKTREVLDQRYGYHLYPGTCHMVPNHAMVLASILHGGDDFQKSVMIATSAGWDTDCNAGNVGAFNGIRLGLPGIHQGADLRTAVADRLLVITSDGGAAVSDATRESEHILEAICRLRGMPYAKSESRFSFGFPGALQGFSVCPHCSSEGLPIRVEPTDSGYLSVVCSGLGRGLRGAVSTPTFVEFLPNESSYLSTASPTLYETQTVTCRLELVSDGDVEAGLYVVVDGDKGPQPFYSTGQKLFFGQRELKWTIPPLGGQTILRVGVYLNSGSRYSGQIRIRSMNWGDAPENFCQEGTLMRDIWDLHPKQFQMWTSSARNFTPDMRHTFCISHPEENGLATIGTEDWTDYEVSSQIQLALSKKAGLVLRCKGHRQYYGAALDGAQAEIFAMVHGVRHVVGRAAFGMEPERPYHVAFRCAGEELTLAVDGEVLVQAEDRTFRRGGCGFFVDCGTMLADGFQIRAISVRDQKQRAALTE